MRQVCLSIFALLLFSPTAFVRAQQVLRDPSESETTKETTEVKAEREQMESLALVMLKQTVSEIQTLRTPENRISLSAGLVEIMWKHDPDSAREIFRTLANSFVQLFTEYASRANVVGAAQGSQSLVMRSEAAKAATKMRKAFAVRENLVRAAAGMGPMLALRFVRETSAAVSDGVFADQLKQSDSKLMVMIVERYGAADPKVSDEVGAWLVKDGLNDGAIAQLQQLMFKDRKAGAEYAAVVFSAASRDLNRASPNYEAQAALLRYASRIFDAKDGEDRAADFVSQSEVQFQAEAFGRALLRQAELSEDMASEYAGAIRPFSKTMAERVEKKFSRPDESLSPETARLANLLAASRAKDAKQLALKSAAKIVGDDSGPSGIGTGKADPLSELSKITEEGATDQERQEMADKARAAADQVEMPAMKIGVLTVVATRLKELGDDARAKELVDEADGLVTNRPKNYQDYMEVWVLASGIATVDPERSFSRLEDAIFRVNDVINAGIIIAEFADVNGEIVQDGELLVGAFAGGMTANISRSLAQSGNVILGLARSDFERTKMLAERFDRPEVRILAKTLVLEAVLNDEPGKQKQQQGMRFLF